MGWFARLLGIKPDRRKLKQTGFFWGGDDRVALAAGRGWNQPVVGESFYRKAIQSIVGGPTVYGVGIDCVAEIRTSSFEGEPSLEIWIESRKVGSISKEDAPQMLDELAGLQTGQPITAKANISAGYEGGHYCVQLSLSRPLKQRKS